jgi:hypothetical protein
MERILHVIESDKGYLSDIEEYTYDLMEAVTFVDFTYACKRLASISGVLSTPCWIGAVHMPFPRPAPFVLDKLRKKEK